MIDVPRETRGVLERYIALLRQENARQNLISKSTEADIWNRHIVDALQLIPYAAAGGAWADIGTGPGLPGLVVAIATGDPVTLIEPRPLRVRFLVHVKEKLGLRAVSIVQGKAAAATGSFDTITARAVAKADELIAMTRHLSHSETRWVLPKGRTVRLELEAVESSWQGRFRVEPSLTDPEAGIIIAEQVKPRGRR